MKEPKPCIRDIPAPPAAASAARLFCEHSVPCRRSSHFHRRHPHLKRWKIRTYQRTVVQVSAKRWHLCQRLPDEYQWKNLLFFPKGLSSVQLEADWK